MMRSRKATQEHDLELAKSAYKTNANLKKNQLGLFGIRPKKLLMFCLCSPCLFLYLLSRAYIRGRVYFSSDETLTEEMVAESMEISFFKEYEVPSLDWNFFGRFFSDTQNSEDHMNMLEDMVGQSSTSQDQSPNDNFTEASNEEFKLDWNLDEDFFALDESSDVTNSVELSDLEKSLSAIYDLTTDGTSELVEEKQETTDISFEVVENISEDNDADVLRLDDLIEETTELTEEQDTSSQSKIVQEQQDQTEKEKISVKVEKLVLQPQIELPKKTRPLYQNLNNERNFWPVQRHLRRLGWSAAGEDVHPSRVSLFFSKGRVPSFLLKKYKEQGSNWKRYSNKMINTIGVSGCIGGQKSLQLSCRQNLATFHGCDYADLHIQPPQYVIENKEDCDKFFKKYSETNLQWLYKPSNSFHGAGIKLYTNTKSLLKKFNFCSDSKKTYNRYNNGVIMQYINNPATIKDGYKFDFRTFLLVASTDPLLVFYHDGFARKADVKLDTSQGPKNRNAYITNSVTQSEKDHFFNFSTTDDLLFEETQNHFPRSFFASKREYLKKTTRFMFETVSVQEKKIKPRKGRFHLFGVDWVVDRQQKIHLLEGNGFPLVSHYPGIGLTPKIWEEMTDLLLAIHTKPEVIGEDIFDSNGFSFGGWDLIYNELEDVSSRSKFNVCSTFPAQ